MVDITTAPEIKSIQFRPAPRQMDCLREIRRQNLELFTNPSVRELTEALGLKSTRATSDLLYYLHLKLCVTSVPNKPRTLRVTRWGLYCLEHYDHAQQKREAL